MTSSVKNHAFNDLLDDWKQAGEILSNIPSSVEKKVMKKYREVEAIIDVAGTEWANHNIGVHPEMSSDSEYYLYIDLYTKRSFIPGSGGVFMRISLLLYKESKEAHTTVTCYVMSAHDPESPHYREYSVDFHSDRGHRWKVAYNTGTNLENEFPRLNRTLLKNNVNLSEAVYDLSEEQCLTFIKSFAEFTASLH